MWVAGKMTFSKLVDGAMSVEVDNSGGWRVIGLIMGKMV